MTKTEPDLVLWTKFDRDSYIEFPSNADNIEDYMEDLVDVWHTSPTSVRLAEFLGITWEEYKVWAGQGTVPDRITLMWVMGDY